MATIPASGLNFMAKIDRHSSARIEAIEKICNWCPVIFINKYPPFYKLDITIFDPPV